MASEEENDSEPEDFAVLAVLAVERLEADALEISELGP